MRVFLDTNVIASATATRGLCADVLRFVVAFADLVVSDHLLAEVRRILRDKFGAPADLVEDVLWLLRADTILAESKPLADLPLTDVADIAIVSAAINGGANLLVTGDKEILGLGRVGGLEIVSPRQYWERQKGRPPCS
jgi:putative PIN family toxin of toxin-antitoxin system